MSRMGSGGSVSSGDWRRLVVVVVVVIVRRGVGAVAVVAAETRVVEAFGDGRATTATHAAFVSVVTVVGRQDAAVFTVVGCTVDDGDRSGGGRCCCSRCGLHRAVVVVEAGEVDLIGALDAAARVSEE